jgi:hypothetical protein
VTKDNQCQCLNCIQDTPEERMADALNCIAGTLHDMHCMLEDNLDSITRALDHIDDQIKIGNGELEGIDGALKCRLYDINENLKLLRKI